MASITVRNLEDSVKKKLRMRAAKHGHSMEEEVRQILRAAVGQERTVPQNDKELSATEARLPELEKRGVLVRGDPDKHFKPGKPDPGALKQFLKDR